jgi:hypothetical protein
LILSKAILCAGGLEALRPQEDAAQNQKCFGLKDLPLAVRWRHCSRLGRASSPTVGERALPASQQIGNLDTWEISQRCPYERASQWDAKKDGRSKIKKVAIYRFTGPQFYFKIKVWIIQISTLLMAIGKKIFLAS